MMILLQIAVFFLALTVLAAVFRLAFQLLVRLWLLPPLIWWALGKVLYPQWSAAHPLLFYGVLAVLILVMLAVWFGPLVARQRENKRLERMVSEGISRARAEGRTIDNIQLENGVPVITYRD